MEINLQLSPKQKHAFEILRDKQTTELFFGGGAGGGKSYLGCIWLIFSCLAYPGTRWLMGRARLKSLKESTFLSFLAVLKDWGLKKDTDWKYNAQEHFIQFLKTGSSVYMKDLFLYPTDPEFDSLGSTEYTGAFMDEVSEITEKAKMIVMSRLRYKLDEYDLIPKLLMASNPAKNWAYKEYWRPWTEGKLEDYREFIPALVGDNPFMSKYYVENLNKLDKNSKERLLYGNWNYSDDPSMLFNYNKIIDIFTNQYNIPHRANNYMSCDVARFGKDKTIIVVWCEYHIETIVSLAKSSIPQVVEKLNELATKYRVPHSNIIIDEDGVGGGVVDYMENCVGFVNNSIPIETDFTKKIHNYRNLKTQCYFKLAEVVNNGKIGCYKDIPLEVKEGIIQDLEQIKARTATGSNGQVLNEGKLEVINKKELHDVLGRSTDYSDAMMMRCYFDLDDYYTPYIV